MISDIQQRSHGIWNANLFTCEIESYDVWSLALVYRGVVHDTICNNISAEKVIDYVDMIKKRS